MKQRSSGICSTCALHAKIFLNPRGEEKSKDCIVVLSNTGVVVGSKILKTMMKLKLPAMFFSISALF